MFDQAGPTGKRCRLAGVLHDSGRLPRTCQSMFGSRAGRGEHRIPRNTKNRDQPGFCVLCDARTMNAENTSPRGQWGRGRVFVLPFGATSRAPLYPLRFGNGVQRLRIPARGMARRLHVVWLTADPNAASKRSIRERDRRRRTWPRAGGCPSGETSRKNGAGASFPSPRPATTEAGRVREH